MKVKPILLSLLACAMLAGQVHAEEYTFDESGSYQYGTPTSMEEVHTEEEPENTDRSKNVALIPPGFGTPTSYLPGSGEYLTPNLVPDALDGGLVEQVGEVNYPAVNAGAADATAQSAIEVSYQPTVQTAQASFTDVTDDLYYSGGHLGTLSIPRLARQRENLRRDEQRGACQGCGTFHQHQHLGRKCLRRGPQSR